MSIAVEGAPPSRVLTLLESRALPELGAFWLMRPWLSTTPRGDGHCVDGAVVHERAHEARMAMPPETSREDAIVGAEEAV